MLEALGAAVRGRQRADDRFDEAVVELCGLKRSEGRVVDLVQQFGPMTAGEVARAAHLSTGAVTAVIDRLVEKGYVRRAADPSDRRRVRIELTPATLQFLGEIFGPLTEDAAGYLARFTDEQLETILEFVELDRELHERHAEALESGARQVKLPKGTRKR